MADNALASTNTTPATTHVTPASQSSDLEPSSSPGVAPASSSNGGSSATCPTRTATPTVRRHPQQSEQGQPHLLCKFGVQRGLLRGKVGLGGGLVACALRFHFLLLRGDCILKHLLPRPDSAVDNACTHKRRNAQQPSTQITHTAQTRVHAHT